MYSISVRFHINNPFAKVTGINEKELMEERDRGGQADGKGIMYSERERTGREIRFKPQTKKETTTKITTDIKTIRISES